MRDSTTQDGDNIMDYEDVDSDQENSEKNQNDDEDDDIDFINQKIDEDDEDFDVREERRKLKSKNKALKSTSPKGNVGRPRRQANKLSNENIYSKVYKTASKNEELNASTDVRVTRRLSLRRASINRASSNSNDMLIKKEDNEESDSNKFINKVNGKSRRGGLKISSNENEQNIETEENNEKPKRKYRSYLAKQLEEEKEMNKKLLNEYKTKHGYKFRQCLVTLERVAQETKEGNDETESSTNITKTENINDNVDKEVDASKESKKKEQPNVTEDVGEIKSEEIAETKNKVEENKLVIDDDSLDYSTTTSKKRRSTRVTRNKAKLN